MHVLNKKLFRDLLHLRGQMIAIALVVACGVASYVSMRSTYQSLLQTRAVYYRQFRFADVFAQLKRAPESAATRIRDYPDVASVQTRVVVDVVVDVKGLEEPAVGRLISLPPHKDGMLNGLYLRSGRYPQPGVAGEVLVSRAFSNANRLQIGDSIPAVINGRWQRLTVVGIALSPEYIYEIRGGGSLFPDNRHFGVFWMDRDALASAFSMEGAFNDLTLELRPQSNVQDVLALIDRTLARYGGLGAYDREDQLSHRFISDEIAQNRISSNVVPAIFLGVAAFLVHLVLSRLVSTQRTQLGLIKAFGYSNRDVGLHFLKLALVPGIVGTVLGTAVGWFLGSKLTALYADVYSFPILQYRVTAAVVVQALLLTLAASAFGGLLATHRVLALGPAEAMRPESPSKFRRGWMEQTGIQSLLSSNARMIVRNVCRRKIRAALSVLAIGSGVGILVLEFGFLDCINRMMEVEFRHVQREDLTVSFNETRDARAIIDLERLPGVMRAEAYRAVPVRLRHEHRVHRTAILGLGNGELRRVLDRNTAPVALPPEGLVLTKILADKLGASAGDEVTVEVLESSRPIRHVTVVSLVDELFGTNAYMETGALNRLMREGPAISGAFIQADGEYEGRLYKLLKRMPAVGAVSIRQGVLDSFRQTLDQSMRISVVMLIAFACVITAGMTYNSVRIALSERATELASLRILGFTRHETTVLLLGEQGLIILAALPIGFLLGLVTFVYLAKRLESELYRVPVIIEPASLAWTVVITAIASILAAVLVRRQLARLDLIAVLKARE
jgi:putative ABC transport system permease protein